MQTFKSGNISGFLPTSLIYPGIYILPEIGIFNFLDQGRIIKLAAETIAERKIRRESLIAEHRTQISLIFRFSYSASSQIPGIPGKGRFTETIQIQLPTGTRINTQGAYHPNRISRISCFIQHIGISPLIGFQILLCILQRFGNFQYFIFVVYQTTGHRPAQFPV